MEVNEFSFFFFSFIFCLHWVFIAACRLSIVVTSGRYSSCGALATLPCSVRASHCSGFSCCGARALGARASVAVARGL